MTIEYDQLATNPANFVPLTPLSFLQRTADIYPQREAVIYNQRRYSWAQIRNRCMRIASSLAARGIGRNDTVSVLAFNTPEIFESHFSVPMAGAVLNTINTRLDADTVGYIIDHGESKLFICDRQLWPVLADALQSCQRRPEIVIIDDPDAVEKPELPSDLEFSYYEDLVERGDDAWQWQPPADEWQALTL
ncbi:MAG TPA: AMP-binding protein, partial [Gammaproteobacteria bacterium]